MRYVANCSFGKDSLAMVLLLIEKGYPLDEVIFFDTGKEFQAIYNLRDQLKPFFETKGIKFTQLIPMKSFDYMMFEHKTKSGKTGYGWCGGICRWGTTYKIAALDKHSKAAHVYIGVAADEHKRLQKSYGSNKSFPLAKWGMSEQNCLDYCYSQGYNWDENGVELYSILDRVSCWCCRNKNLRELKNIYLHLPDYWQKLKDIQTLLPAPMKGCGKSVFDLEKRFKAECEADKHFKIGDFHMLEKVNKYHPDKIADRIAGAIVDCAYTLDDNPKIAVEVLIGHSRATVIAETSMTLEESNIKDIVVRIAGDSIDCIDFIQVAQDTHLSKNQSRGFHCGDNGVFTAQWNADYEKATELAVSLGEQFPYDGKYLFDFEKGTATICQSNTTAEDIENFIGFTFKTLIINPLGEWTGGTNTDTGCTNRKLGSDQPFCNPNGLHGKDLSKADVSISIYINQLSRKLGGSFVKAYCSIGDDTVNIFADGHTAIQTEFSDIVESAREYIQNLGGFEKFAEYGMR